MLLSDRGERIFRELRLTTQQTRVYLALFKLANPSTARAISTHSNVARQDIYHSLTELQELSLVETIIGKPAMFRAVQPQEAIASLIKRKKQMTQALITEATELIEFFPDKEEKPFKQENDQFVFVTKKEACINKVRRAIKASQKDIIVITPWREVIQWLFILHELWNNALDRGVNVRWITGKQENNNLPKEAKIILLNPQFKLRIQPKSSLKNISYGIYDDKELLISTKNGLNATESPALWTNNPSIIYMLKDYFEEKWSKAKDYEANSFYGERMLANRFKTT